MDTFDSVTANWKGDSVPHSLVTSALPPNDGELQKLVERRVFSFQSACARLTLRTTRRCSPFYRGAVLNLHATYCKKKATGACAMLGLFLELACRPLNPCRTDPPLASLCCSSSLCAITAQESDPNPIQKAATNRAEPPSSKNGSPCSAIVGSWKFWIARSATPLHTASRPA